MTIVEEMRAKGFTSVDRLAGDDVLDELAQLYDDVLARRIDCGSDDRLLGGVTRQVMNPRRHSPAVAANGVFAAAREVCGELLGTDEPQFLFDMMIFKPAGHPNDTPWHQDLSYFIEPFTPGGTRAANAFVQVWIAVDDADEENGCMHFVPGAHLEPMQTHHIASGAEDMPSRLLAITDAETVLDLGAAEARPLSRGGATFHYENTPHYTPPNRSADRPRRAYIVNFVDPSRARLS